MKRKDYFSLLLGLWLLWAAGCSLPEPPRLVAISNPPVFKPKTPEEVKTPDDAMAAVITITSKELGLPLVEPLYLHLHKDSTAFGAYAGRYGTRLPQEVVQFAVAVAEENRFHINMEKIGGRPWSALIRTLAHEYAHNIEFALSVQRGPQWIREGFADWVAAKVLHSLGWQDYDLSRHRAELEVSRLHAPLPSLSDLADPQKWTLWASQPKGAVMTYRVALLAVDRLVERNGLPAVKKYFASQDFQGSFGLPWNEFETDFAKSLAETQPLGRKGFKAQRPQWKIGDQWQYDWKSPGKKGTLKKEIIREDAVDGTVSYVMRVGGNENYYTKELLALQGTFQKGRAVTKRSPPYEFLSWPLEVGKEWRSVFVLENAEQKSSQTLDYQIVLADFIDVPVRAGNFPSFKIDVYSSRNGSLLAEEWYSPEVKWFVKERIYLSEGVREEELTSFKTN